VNINLQDDGVRKFYYVFTRDGKSVVGKI